MRAITIIMKRSPGSRHATGAEGLLAVGRTTMAYLTSPASRKPSAEITPLSTGNAREYWRRQSVIDGTTWEQLGRCAARAMWRAGLTSSLCWSST